MPPKNTIQIAVTDELAAAIDKARGPLSRSAWARAACEQQLTKSGVKAGTAQPPAKRKAPAPPNEPHVTSRTGRSTLVEPRFGSKIPNTNR